MILQELYKLYDRLVEEKEYHIPPPGYSLQNISFCVVLNEDGTFELQDERTTQENGKAVPRQLIVPGSAAHKSGNGESPMLLCDNSKYLFGYSKKGEGKDAERAKKLFEASKNAHIELAKKFPDEPDIQAVAQFFEKWNIERDLPPYREQIEGFGSGNGVFRLAGKTKYTHENNRVADAIVTDIVAHPDIVRLGNCLISGDGNAKIARLHEPEIKNVIGAGIGPKLVSFNCPSFESYGWDQGGNASTSADAANRYCEALNALLRNDKHHIRIGETTIVFWTERKTITESLLTKIFTSDDLGDDEQEESPTEEGSPASSKTKKKKKPSTRPQDPATLGRVKTFLENLHNAGTPETALTYSDGNDNPRTPFFMLGISPNSARLSIRFWHAGTLGDFVAKLKAHHDAMRIQKECPHKNQDFIPLKRILLATVRQEKKDGQEGRRKEDDISPRLGGELMRAILAGTPYPLTLFQQIITRLRHGDEVSYIAASTIKAFLTRNKGTNISMSLDKENKQPAYLLGRLFATLEKSQKKAQGNINATIRERFYATASATPGAVFPILLRTHQHHLAKIENEGDKVFYDKLVQEIICSGLDVFPSHLNLEAQGLFAIGYYHQKCAFFTKKETDSDATPQQKPAQTQKQQPALNI